MSKLVAVKKCSCDELHIIDLDDLVSFAKDAGFYLVPKKAASFGPSTLIRLMDDCLPEQIENEQDMQKMINKLWPALVCEHEQD